jgi:hypothetical protein
MQPGNALDERRIPLHGCEVRRHGTELQLHRRPKLYPFI